MSNGKVRIVHVIAGLIKKKSLPSKKGFSSIKNESIFF